MDKNGRVISFMGIRPKPGYYSTTNRHDCMGKAQVQISIFPDGNIETVCPTCMAHPTVLFECGEFSYFGGMIITCDEEKNGKIIHN